MQALVISVNLSSTHTFSKYSHDEITLLKGLGVKGDVHCGKMMKHRSRLKVKPLPINLRQVHLIHSELFDEVSAQGFNLTPGLIGENITTKGIDLLSLPKNAKLHIGESAVVEITGLRNPCNQLNDLQPGLLSAVLDQDEDGNLIRKSGVMGVVLEGGKVKAGDVIRIEYPEVPFISLERV